MFTGIIQSTAPIVEINKKSNFCTYGILFPKNLLNNLSIGASVSNNGCCLTVTNIKKEIVIFDLINETLKITNLNTVKIGDMINLERSATFSSEIGGHLMSGHIICTAKLVGINSNREEKSIWFNISNQKLMKYIFYKGYIGIDGISLTVGEIKNNRFCVYLIPETISRTTLWKKKLGEYVNVEIDIQTQVIVDSVEKILYSKSNIIL